MIERYVDSLKTAASRAQEFTVAKENAKPQLFVDFIEGLKVSAGSAHQLAQSRMDTRWLDVRDNIEKILDLGKAMPPTKGDDSELWLKIQQVLLNMAENGKKLSNMISQTRLDTLNNLTYRETKIRAESQNTHEPARHG